MVEKIKLVSLKEVVNSKLYEMYQDIPSLELGSTNKLKGLSYEEFKIQCEELVKEETILNEEINTKTNRYILVDEDNYIGEVGIRTTQNEFWSTKGSQVFYKIRQSERNKGYGNIILKLALEECKKLGFKKVRINCSDENIPSKKVIVKNGGKVDIASYKTKDGTSSSYIIELKA